MPKPVFIWAGGAAQSVPGPGLPAREAAAHGQFWHPGEAAQPPTRPDGAALQGAQRGRFIFASYHPYIGIPDILN